MAKSKEERIDGLEPRALKQVTAAIKQCWSWSYPRRLAIARATGKDGFVRCEKCNVKTPKHHVDHKTPVGEIRSAGAIDRLFCPSSGLQVLCKPCHAPKTRQEARERAARKYAIKDFV